MLRLAVFLLMLASAGGAMAQTALPTRLTISTIIVSNSQPSVDADLKAWNSLLAIQLTNLLNDSHYNLANARFLKIEPPQFQSRLLTPDALERRWEQTVAIQIISGTGVQSGGATVFNGDVYLGRLGADLQSATVPLNQPIRAASYKATRDAVALAALYALAVDAGQTRNVACPLLAEARQIHSDLVAARQDVADLGAAVDRRLKALNCGFAR
jgi:hypothetical protein